jgi:hypothetical protein
MEGIFSITNIVVLLFVLTYILSVFFYNPKTYFVWATILITVLLGVVSPIEAFKAIRI